MSQTHQAADPPPYAGDPAVVEDDMIPAETLCLAGRVIHSATPGSPQLYELSHSVGFLTENDRSVRFSRFEYAVREDAGQTPQVSSRSKHIFDLKHPPEVTGPPFSYHLEAVSRRTAGHIGIKPFRSLGSSGYRAWKITRRHKGDDFVSREQVFEVQRLRDHLRWEDEGGRLVAIEDEQEGLQRLVIMAPMNRQTRDALVGTWCLRVWMEIAMGKHQHRGLRDVARILQTRTVFD